MCSTLTCSVASSGGSGLVRVIAGGEELTAPVKRAASVRERARGGGEKTPGRCFGALPVTWLGEGVGDEVQELGSTSGRRGGGGGRSSGEVGVGVRGDGRGSWCVS